MFNKIIKCVRRRAVDGTSVAVQQAVPRGKKEDIANTDIDPRACSSAEEEKVNVCTRRPKLRAGSAMGVA